MFNNNNSDGYLDEPPVHDLLNIKFRGDSYNIVLPYCEVANGSIVALENNTVVVNVAKEGQQENITMPFVEFVEAIEKTFDTKAIVKLAVQKAGSYEEIEIL